MENDLSFIYVDLVFHLWERKRMKLNLLFQREQPPCPRWLPPQQPLNTTCPPAANLFLQKHLPHLPQLQHQTW